ncbi:MAG: acyltransferase family protein [bacterium]
MSSNHPTHYRADIDGLRAIAVLAVIGFHAGFQGFSGGFVGVDVFFVISGFLITGIILREKAENRFSLIDFYRRRIRRIFPALFTVLAVCTPIAWWLLLPHERLDYAQSLLAVAVFGANIYFWQTSDYFSTNAELIPLLHTWTLAVEEQYYLLFPLLILILWRFKKIISLNIIIFLLVTSLLFSDWGWRAFPEANFYLLPFRAWELLAGALAAITYNAFKQETKISIHHKYPTVFLVLTQSLSTLGFILVIGSILLFDNRLPFPSFYTLIPVLGSVLIVSFSHADRGIGRLLSLPIFVGIGLVSYSAYLWHYPIFAFAKLYSIDTPSMGLMLLLSLLTFVLAALSWFFIERPCRQRFAHYPWFLIAFVLIAIVFLSAGSYILLNNYS